MPERRYSDDQALARLLAMGFEQGPTTKRLTRLTWPPSQAPQGTLYLLFSKAQKGVALKVHPEVKVTDLPPGCFVEGDYFNHSLCDFPRAVVDPSKPKTRRGTSVFVKDEKALVALAEAVMKAGMLANPSPTSTEPAPKVAPTPTEGTPNAEPQAANSGVTTSANSAFESDTPPCCVNEACECDASSVPAHAIPARNQEGPKAKTSSRKSTTCAPTRRGFWGWLKGLFTK